MESARPIAVLLWDLVGEDAGRSVQAAEELSLLWGGEEEFSTSFFAAVRSAVDAPGFDTPVFVAALSISLLQVQAELSVTMREALRSMQRTHNLWNYSLDDSQRRVEENLFARSISLKYVLDALDQQLLLVPEGLCALLEDKYLRSYAVDALIRIGPPAAPFFADELLAQLSSDPERFLLSHVLAAMIRGNAVYVRKVAGYLDDPDPKVVRAAAGTVYYLGEEASQLAPECVGRLLALMSDPSLRKTAAATLGSVTRGTDVAIKQLLEMSRDSDIWAKGVAITALGEVTYQPEIVVPRLIEAFEDYQEPDSDCTYYSAHERVVLALRCFGSAAAPAVPALLARIQSIDREELDRGVLETLAAIGVSAREAALPVLERLAKEAGCNEITAEHDYDPLVAAILRLRDVS